MGIEELRFAIFTTLEPISLRPVEGGSVVLGGHGFLQAGASRELVIKQAKLQLKDRELQLREARRRYRDALKAERALLT